MVGNVQRYTVSDYLKHGNRNRSIMLLTSDKSLEDDIIIRLGSDYHLVSIWDLWDEHAPSVMRPQRLWEALVNEEKENGKIIIKGLSDYLFLVNSELKGKLWDILFNLIDGQEHDMIVILNEEDYTGWPNPKYEGSYQVVRLDAEYPIDNPPGSMNDSLQVVLISGKYGVPEDAVSFPQLLNMIHDGKASGVKRVRVDGDPRNYKGLKEFVRRQSESEIVFDILMIRIDEESSSILLDGIDSSGMSPEDYRTECLPVPKEDPSTTFMKLWNLEDQRLFTVYRELALKCVERGSFLHQVLMEWKHGTSFREQFNTITPLNNINSTFSKRWAKERANLLSRLDDKHASINFIRNAKGHPSAIDWMNCGTDDEKYEIIRRVRSLDLENGLPVNIGMLYKDLSMYLGDYEHLSGDVKEYFRQYRVLKIRNEITPDFVSKAESVDKSLDGPLKFNKRDSVLPDYNRDGNKLLTVDGMGCEYMPFVMAILKENGFEVEYATVVEARRPTETRFNRMEWNASDVLEEIKCVDNISHNGKDKHQVNPPEVNLATTLSELKASLLKMLRENIEEGHKIVITSDHGMSRLLIIASEKGLDKKIEYEKPDNWRYTEDDHGNMPEGTVSSSVADGKNYWVARGYNHFIKGGGDRRNEYHGGSTPEERLVPLIVVSGKTAPISYTPPEPKKQKPTSADCQMVEKNIFDI